MKNSPCCLSSAFFALAVLLAAAPGARAEDLVWTNLAGGNWNWATNWNPNQVPGSGDHAWITNNGTYAVALTNNVSVGSLTLGSASGTNILKGSNTLTLTGPLVWQGGVISNTVVLCQDGGQITGSANKNLAGGQLFNSGAMTLGALLYTGSGSVISNMSGGTFDLTTNYGTSYTSNGLRGVFYNVGLLRKTSGTGTARMDDSFTNAGTLETRSGTLRLTATNCAQTAGSTRLLTGGLQVDQGYTLWGGMLSGSNTFTGNLINFSGIVSPSESSWTTNGYPDPGASPAQLTITGNFSQNNGTLVMELGGDNVGTEYDVLAVGNSAALDGTLWICLHPGYTPPPSSTYFFLSAASISGCFAVLNYPLGNAWGWQVLSTFSIVSTTTNTAPVPAFVPDQTIPALCPFDLTFTATDAEAPPQTLTWHLDSRSPTNMTLSPGGQFHWIPTAAQIGTNQIIAEIWDNGGGNCPDGNGPCNQPPPTCASGLGSFLTFNLIVTPSLSLQPAGTNIFLLSWPGPAPGWVLERTNFLNGATNPWPVVPPPYQTNGGVISVNFTNSPPVANQFFRLRQ